MVDKPIQIISNLLRYQWDKVRLVQISSGGSSLFPFPKKCGVLNQVPERWSVKASKWPSWAAWCKTGLVRLKYFWPQEDELLPSSEFSYVSQNFSIACWPTVLQVRVLSSRITTFSICFHFDNCDVTQLPTKIQNYTNQNMTTRNDSMQHKLMQAAFSHQNVTLSFVYQIIICLYLYHNDIWIMTIQNKQLTNKQSEIANLII